MSVTIEQDLDRIVRRIRSDERAKTIAEVCVCLRLPRGAKPWAGNESGYTVEVRNWIADKLERDEYKPRGEGAS